MIRLLLQFSACWALGLFVGLLILVGLMFAGEMGVIKGFIFTGKPLAFLALYLLPVSHPE